MGQCSCCEHGCASEKKVEVKESVLQEYWKAGLSFILLMGGIVMNALDFSFFIKSMSLWSGMWQPIFRSGFL